jgi:hypothetical protein
MNMRVFVSAAPRVTGGSHPASGAAAEVEQGPQCCLGMRPESDAKDRRPRSPPRSDPRKITGAPLPLSGDPAPPLDAPHHRPPARPIVLRPLFLGGLRCALRHVDGPRPVRPFPRKGFRPLLAANPFTLTISSVTVSTFSGRPASGPCSCSASFSRSRSSCSLRSAELHDAPRPAFFSIACRCISMSAIMSITSSVGGFVSKGHAPDSAFRNNGFRRSSIFAAIVPGAAGALCAPPNIRRNVAAVACAQCRGAVLGHATRNRVPVTSRNPAR